MKRILFVDDEPLVLDGLRDLLRPQRKKWEMVFATGGEAALAELGRARFDVVVSDMRMPGIDGVALLRRVKHLFPETARIILSGHADHDALVGALAVAHQFLSKPCDKDVLRTVIERACGLTALMQDERVRRVIGEVDRLPSVPRIYWALVEAAAKPETDAVELARIVEQDPAMAVKVLQLVNSSYFGLAQRHSSVRQAVMSLGADLLTALALTAHVFASVPGPGVKGFSLDALQRHSVLASRIASRFLADKARASEASTAAIVHDIGKIVLAISVPEAYADVLADIAVTGRLDHVVEKALLGVTHAEVGAYLLALWGLPINIVEAVAYHHRPDGIDPTDTLVAVHVANALSHLAPGPDADPTIGGLLDLAFVERSAFGPELPRWRALAAAELLAVADGDP